MPFAFFLAALFFAIALLMHLAGFGSGHIDVTTFELAGLLCLALAGAPAWPWRHRAAATSGD